MRAIIHCVDVHKYLWFAHCICIANLWSSLFPQRLFFQFHYHLDIIQLMWYFNNYLDIIIVFMLFNVCYISLKTQFYIILLSTLSTDYYIICEVPTLNPIFCSIPIKCFIILLLNEWIIHIFSNVSWIRPKHLQVTSDNVFRRKSMNCDHVGNALTTYSNLKTKSILRCSLLFCDKEYFWNTIFTVVCYYTHKDCLFWNENNAIY